MSNLFAEKDIKKWPIKDKDNPRYGHGYTYYDWICPTCGGFLSFEPAFDRIPRRCWTCGQLLKELTREEAENYEETGDYNIPGLTML